MESGEPGELGECTCGLSVVSEWSELCEWVECIG